MNAYPSLRAQIARLALFAFSAMVAVDRAQATEDGAAILTALNSISVDDLKAHVDALADDTFEGREAGSRGGRAAAGYLQNLLEKYGYAGAAAGGRYFQPFGPNHRNLLVKLPGSDPALAGECIIIGAHYDHVGYGTAENSYGPTGLIHNGADDNGSGTSALIELAQALKQLPVAPRRTIILAFWDAEEKGLLGSKYWVEHPTEPLTSVKCMVNLDMVGRLRKDTVEVYGARSAAGLRQMISQANQDGELLFTFDWAMRDDSDHYSFYSKNIPVLMFHTGLHSEYHRPSDDAHLVNHDGIRRIARMCFQLTMDMAERDSLPAFRPASRNENAVVQRDAESPQPPLPGRLGLTWRTGTLGTAVRGVVVGHVVPQSPAANAGIAPGDVVMEVNGRPLESGEQLRREVLVADKPLTLLVRTSQRDQPREVSVQLAGEPVLVGIAWREDAAEPNVAVVTRVVPGSAADLAGIKVQDRLLAIGQKPFSNVAELQAMITPLEHALELTLERQGQIHHVMLRPLVTE